MIAFTGLFTSVVSAQTEAKGTITTSGNEVVEGTIKDQMQKKGSILFINAAGAKKTVFAF